MPMADDLKGLLGVAQLLSDMTVGLTCSDKSSDISKSDNEAST